MDIRRICEHLSLLSRLSKWPNHKFSYDNFVFLWCKNWLLPLVGQNQKMIHWMWIRTSPGRRLEPHHNVIGPLKNPPTHKLHKIKLEDYPVERKKGSVCATCFASISSLYLISFFTFSNPISFHVKIPIRWGGFWVNHTNQH